MKIGELSNKTGLSIHTIRYYEKIGLMKKNPKNSSGHREYSDIDIQWIQFISCLKATEMTLEKIKYFIKLIRKGESTIPERFSILKEQRKHLEDKIVSLHAHRDHIDYKLKNFEKFFGKNLSGY